MQNHNLKHHSVQSISFHVVTFPPVLQNAMYDTQQAHAAQLTSLRLPHRTMRLKPMTEANNPILAKRRQNR